MSVLTEIEQAGCDGDLHARCLRCGEKYRFKSARLVADWVAIHENPAMHGRFMGCRTAEERQQDLEEWRIAYEHD